MKIVLVYFLASLSLSSYAQLSVTSPKKQISDSAILKVDSNLLSILHPRKPIPVYTDYDIQKKDLQGLTIFIDSVKNSALYANYIEPLDIAEVNVYKNNVYPNGVIYVTLKDHKILSKLLDSKLLSLKDIKNTFVVKKENEKPIIFLLNKELVTDTAMLRIPEICLENVTIAEAAQIPYFKTTFPDALIMMITTHPISNKPYQPDIFIKGKANN